MWSRRRVEYSGRRMDAGEQLVDEAEAFLTGDYARRARYLGGTLPGWAWLNPVAHGDLARIRRLRRYLRGALAPFDSLPREQWKGVQRALVEDVLRIVADDPERLSRVQRRVLVPLELQLIQFEKNGPLTPFEFARTTRAALRAGTS